MIIDINLGQGYLNDATREFSYFLPMDALMFPLSEYVIKLIPSQVTFRNKEGQNIGLIYIGSYGKCRFKPLC